MMHADIAHNYSLLPCSIHAHYQTQFSWIVQLLSNSLSAYITTTFFFWQNKSNSNCNAILVYFEHTHTRAHTCRDSESLILHRVRAKK